MYTGTVVEPTVGDHSVGVPELKYIGLADPPIVVEPNLDAVVAVSALPCNAPINFRAAPSLGYIMYHQT